MSGIFDPSEQETKELLPKNKSDMSDYTCLLYTSDAADES